MGGGFGFVVSIVAAWDATLLGATVCDLFDLFSSHRSKKHSDVFEWFF